MLRLPVFPAFPTTFSGVISVDICRRQNKLKCVSERVEKRKCCFPVFPAFPILFSGGFSIGICRRQNKLKCVSERVEKRKCSLPVFPTFPTMFSVGFSIGDYVFTGQSSLLTTLQKKPSENNVGKEEMLVMFSIAFFCRARENHGLFGKRWN